MTPQLLINTDAGLYCPAGDFYVDPWRPVRQALITHAHSDHARPGMQQYLAHHDTVPMLRHRLGAGISAMGVPYGERMTIGDARVSLHPAGHLVGSAQVRIEHAGEVWVVSGDYKRRSDPFATVFEVVPCHTFVTECTFGVPIYTWPHNHELAADMNAWWSGNRQRGISSVLFCYALGKAQRILGMVDTSIGPIYTHGAVEAVNTVLRAQGVPLPHTTRLSDISDKGLLGQSLILAPGSAANTPWLRRAGTHSTAVASGWMAVRGNRRRRAADRGFVLSDHVDWPDLLQTVRDTGAERILATHGYTSVFVRWLREQGYDAHELHTLFGEEDQESVTTEEA